MTNTINIQATLAVFVEEKRQNRSALVTSKSWWHC